MQSINLSICIPTYNRSSFLGKSMKCFIEEISKGGFVDSIEIVVSDNASTDNTREIVELYKEGFKNIICNRNEENLGFDRNIEKIFELATGEYVWLFGDDDWVSSGGVGIVMEMLNKNDVGAMILNWISYYPDGRVSGKGLNFESDQFYHSANEMLKNVQSTFFLSSMIFKKELVCNREQLAGYISPPGFFHWGLFLNAATHSSVCAVMATPIICHRVGNESYLNHWPEIFLNHMPYFFSKRSQELGISKEAIDAQLSTYVRKDSFLTIVHCRTSFNRSTRDVYPTLKKSFTFFKGYLSYYLFTIPAFLIPAFVLRTAVKSYRILKNKSRGNKLQLKGDSL